MFYMWQSEGTNAREMALVALAAKPAASLRYYLHNEGPYLFRRLTDERERVKLLIRHCEIKYSRVTLCDSSERVITSPGDLELTPCSNLVSVDVEIATCAYNFARLDFAQIIQSDRLIGTALGYPRAAIDALYPPLFSKCIKMQESTVVGLLVAARRAGYKIPEWYGYISHVPSKMDIIAGNVCEESRELGENYRDAIYANDPLVGRGLDKYADIIVSELEEIYSSLIARK